MTVFASMATRFGEITDCRKIQFELEFFQVSSRQQKLIAEIFYSKCKHILQDSFYTKWYGDCRFISEEKIRQSFLTSHQVVRDFGFIADVFSSVVNDQKSFKAYETKLKTMLGVRDPQSRISVDYLSVLDEYDFANISTASYKEFLLHLFYTPNRKYLNYWTDHDAYGHFTSCQHYGHQNLFYGSCSFSIAMGCVEDFEQTLADQLIKIAYEVSNVVKNTSARISLSPFSRTVQSCSGHMWYFGGRIEGDGSHLNSGFAENEWYPFYYSRGAEWFNLISPLQLTNISSMIDTSRNFSELIITQNSNGGVFLQLKKDISRIDVSDLIPIKKLMYNALYPGQSKMKIKHLHDLSMFGYMTKPRYYWEYVPIFPEEIEVQEDCILFMHNAIIQPSIPMPF